MGAARTVVIAAALALAVVAGIAGCGSSPARPSQREQASLKRIDVLLSALTALDGQINIAPAVHKRDVYVQTQGPLIDRFGRTSQQLQQEIAGLNDAQAASLYAPLYAAIDQEARDLNLFLRQVMAHNAAGIKSAFAQVSHDEERVNRVALEQFPKVRAYVVHLGSG